MDLWMIVGMVLCWNDSRSILSDRDRFPPQFIAQGNVEFNRSYRNYVESRFFVDGEHNHWYWATVISETDYLYHCWDWLNAAQGGEGKDEEYWIKSLNRLRELIGEEAYSAGSMPTCVPLHRFHFMK